MENLRLVEINTTAFNEENIFLVTDLTDEQIESVIVPIVEAERNQEDYYDNESLIGALLMVYSSNIVIGYNSGGIDKLTI
jgi:hypothetical protein